MQFQDYSKEAVCELLLFLADHEDFSSLQATEGFHKKDVKDVLKQIAAQLRHELAEDLPPQRPQYNQLSLSTKAMSLVSCLSPREEMLLFKSFKVL